MMITSERIRIAFGDDGLRDVCQNDVEFVLCAPRFWTALKLMVAPALWVGESFTTGSWYLSKGNLSEFLRVIRNDAPAAFRRYYEFTAAFKGLRYYLSQYLLNNYYTRKVKHHYEVDPNIYEMILDEEMVYTCAFFEVGSETLEFAQQYKLAAAISRMELSQNHPRILDIGCGWGATARALVKYHPSVEVCGLSLSGNQIEWARRKDSLSLSTEQLSRIEYRIEDYTDHDRNAYYDAVSVIGMIEHVGLGGYYHFFSSIYRFLKPGGTALVQTIVSPTPGEPTNRWIDRHIFTGGYAPATSELVTAIERHPFRVAGIHVYGPRHYRRTIECWIENFTRNAGSIASYLTASGSSPGEVEKFIRTWLFYLSGVRNMFADDETLSHQVVQVCIKKL
jgi:cyclopropane-fatty-acyl-phospholipid synthase